jgi:hypothetical protein
VYAVRPLSAEDLVFLGRVAQSERPEIWLDIHGACLHIQSNVPATIAAVREGYAYFEVDPPPSRTRHRWHHILSLSSEGEGYVQLVSRIFEAGRLPPHCLLPLDYGRAYCIGSYETLHYLTGSFFTSMMEALLFDNYMIVHGAAVVREAGVIFPGALRCGKTTLTLGLLQHGFRFASDDVVLINRATRMVHAYPRLLNVRAESLTAVPGLNRDYPNMTYALVFGEPRWFLNKSDRAAEPFSCRYVVFPRVGGTRTRLIPIAKSDAALRLIANSFYPITPTKRYSSSAENLSTTEELLRDSDCFRMLQTEPAEAIATVLNLVAA